VADFGVYGVYRGGVTRGFVLTFAWWAGEQACGACRTVCKHNMSLLLLPLTGRFAVSVGRRGWQNISPRLYLSNFWIKFRACVLNAAFVSLHRLARHSSFGCAC
jgi:hypothetical protein